METRRIDLTVDGEPLNARLERMQGYPGPRRVAAYWYWIAGHHTSDPIEAKLFQIQEALTTGNRAAAAIAVTMVEPEDPADAKTTIQRFLDAAPNLNGYLSGLATAN